MKLGISKEVTVQAQKSLCCPAGIAEPWSPCREWVMGTVQMSRACGRSNKRPHKLST